MAWRKLRSSTTRARLRANWDLTIIVPLCTVTMKNDPTIDIGMHSTTMAVAADERPCHPGFVRRAKAFIFEHFNEDISLDQIAAAAGVSSRSLFRGFKHYVGASPMSVLKQRRLEAAHDELLTADPSKSVTNIAHHWGFAHVGRFAREYRRRFGEKPSETLRKH